MLNDPMQKERLEDLQMKPGKIIKRARVLAGKSVKEIAIDTGISWHTIHRIEKGETDALWGNIVALLNHLDIDVVYRWRDAMGMPIEPNGAHHNDL